MPPSPIAAVLGGALALLHVAEHGGDNQGEMVALMLRDVGQQPGAKWCAAYVHRAGYYALLDPASGRSRWPLPATASCQLLGDIAGTKGIIATTPVPGDIFLLWDAALAGFHHTGFVLTVEHDGMGATCTTIEGNTADTAFPGTGCVALHTRYFPRSSSSRFIRWASLVTA